MEDFTTINDVIAETVKNSSYTTVLISSIVFILYTIIIRVVDLIKSKNKDKPILEMSKALKDMADNIVKLNGVLDKTLQDSERKQQKQCENSIKLGFKSLGFKIVQYCSEIIAHNNIETNKERIITNLTKLISTEYYNLYSSLAIYEIHDINVGTKLKEEWIKELSDNIIAIIYNRQDNVIRITQMNNYVNLATNEYATYVINKLFN